MAWLLTSLIAAIIAGLTLTPAPPDPVSVSGVDKLYHFAAFAALAAPLSHARPRWLWQVVLAAALYGGMIELIQPFVGRGAELMDLVADAAGALAGGGAAVLLRRMSARGRTPWTDG